MSISVIQNMTAHQRSVIERVDTISISKDPAEYHLRLAARAAAAAVRADPHNGNGRRRVTQAIEAAAQLLAALNKMDEGGKDKPR